MIDSGPGRAGALPDAAALAALRAGRLVVFPTETLYRVGCDALDAAALERLRAAKRRPDEKGIGVIVGDVAMVDLVAVDASPDARRLMDAFWPGPLTLLLRARPDIPSPLVVDGLIGVRLSSDPDAAALSRALGRPLASPSANPSGAEPALDAAAARRYFGDLVAAYIERGPIRGAPSTLVDPGPPLRVLREGAIPTERIEAVLRAPSGPAAA